MIRERLKQKLDQFGRDKQERQDDDAKNSERQLLCLARQIIAISL
jgi:hypothetical protein